MKYDSRREEITKIVVHLAGFLHRDQKDKQPNIEISTYRRFAKNTILCKARKKCITTMKFS